MQLIFTKVCWVILLKPTNFYQSPLDNFIQVCSAGSCSGSSSDGLAKCWMLPSYLGTVAVCCKGFRRDQGMLWIQWQECACDPGEVCLKLLLFLTHLESLVWADARCISLVWFFFFIPCWCNSMKFRELFLFTILRRTEETGPVYSGVFLKLRVHYLLFATVSLSAIFGCDDYIICECILSSFSVKG